jgi:hypothetical protein
MNSIKVNRLFGLSGAITFCVVGLVFLILPQGVLLFFNTVSISINMQPAPIIFPGFFLILTAGYMYVVSFIAFMMYKHPDNPAYVLVLANAKTASAFLSLFLIFWDSFYLIYLTNFIVDGLIGMAAWYLYGRVKA